MNRRTTLLAALVLAACTADLPTAPGEAPGAPVQGVLPPPPPPPTPLTGTLAGADGAPVSMILGVYATPVFAKVTVSGLLSYQGTGSGWLAGSGQYDASGFFIPTQCAQLVQVAMNTATTGAVIGGPTTCTSQLQMVDEYTRYRIIQGTLSAYRTAGPPGSCWKVAAPCISITGSQTVTIEPQPAALVLTGSKSLVAPGSTVTVTAKGVWSVDSMTTLPLSTREWRWEGSGPVVGGGQTQVCATTQPTSCLVRVYQSGHVVLEALVNGVVKTERIWITVVGGDSVPPPPVDTIPTDTIPTDTLPPGGGDGGGGCSASVPTGSPGVLAACEPPDDTVKVPSIRVASGSTLMLPVLAHLFNARTQGARNKLANGARAPAERSDVVTVEVDVKTDRGTATSASVWVVSSPVAGSGGHYHFDPDAVGIARPRGTFFPLSAGATQFMDSVGGTRDSILVAVPDTGTVRLHYRSSGLGGQEWISVRIAGADASTPRDSLSVLVAWPGLSRMSWEGTAYTFNHSSNHAGGDDYAAPGIGTLLDSILTMYRDRHDLDPETYPMTGRVFTVDAATLSLGGLYDIGWSAEEVWRYPHEQHRTGLDVDINNTSTEGVPGQMQQVCGSFYYNMSATVRLKVYCELHNNNHYHIFFGPMRPRSAPR